MLPPFFSSGRRVAIVAIAGDQISRVSCGTIIARARSSLFLSPSLSLSLVDGKKWSNYLTDKQRNHPVTLSPRCGHAWWQGKVAYPPGRPGVPRGETPMVSDCTYPQEAANQLTPQIFCVYFGRAPAADDARGSSRGKMRLIRPRVVFASRL